MPFRCYTGVLHACRLASSLSPPQGPRTDSVWHRSCAFSTTCAPHTLDVNVQWPPDIVVTNSAQRVSLDGHGLHLQGIVSLGMGEKEAILCPEASLRVKESALFLKKSVKRAFESNDHIYGVTTNFGGQAKVAISSEEASSLQLELVHGLNAGTGNFLPDAIVRGAMAVRANTLMVGASGIRLDLVNRLVFFLNNGLVPLVREYGSLGSSGDLIPLASVAGAICGLQHFNVKCQASGEILAAPDVVTRHRLEPVTFDPKEALAIVNGTSFCTSLAAMNVVEYEHILRLVIHVHALMAQALCADFDSFERFVHDASKPHEGQCRAARCLRALLEDSKFIRGGHAWRPAGQDVYSLRCLPQYLSPFVHDINTFKCAVEVEANSVTDNPIIDLQHERIHQQGNFYAGDLGLRMDQLRLNLAMVIKHLDIQMGLLMHGAFSNGLNPSLVPDGAGNLQFGLKGLQISANSLCTLLHQMSSSVVDKTNSHYEQFNQNITSQGYLAGLLTHRSLDIARQHVSLSLLAAMQALQLRQHASAGTYDISQSLGSKQLPLLNAIMELAGMVADEPLVGSHIHATNSLAAISERITHDLRKGSSSTLYSCTSYPSL